MHSEPWFMVLLTARYLSCHLGAPVFPVPELMQHPQYPFLIAKLDFVAVLLNPETGEFDNPVNIHCRTDTNWNLSRLQEEIPAQHDLYCRAQMLVSGLKETILIYLCDNNEGGVVLYRIPSGKMMEQKLMPHTSCQNGIEPFLFLNINDA